MSILAYRLEMLAKVWVEDSNPFIRPNA